VPASTIFYMSALSVLFLAFLFRSPQGRQELIGLHLVMFVLEMFAYGALWVGYAQHEEVDGAIIAQVLVLLCVYIASTLWLGRLLRRYASSVVLATLVLRDRDVAVGLGLWLTLKALLYAGYGNDALLGLNDRVVAGVPRLLVDLDRFLLWIAWGAYYSYILRARPRDLFSKAGMFVILFVLIDLFFENGGGGKRLVISTGVVILYLRGDSVTPRKAWAGAVLVCAMIVAMGYYEKVRSNFSELVFASADRSAVTWTEVKEAFIPRAKRQVAEELQIREAPIALLYALRIAQSDGIVAGGLVAKQILANLIPGGVWEKHFEDEDAVITETFNFPEEDLPTTSVAVFQTELSVAAYILTPGLYVFLFWLYCYCLRNRIGIAGVSLLGALENMAILGGAFTTALSIENGLTGVLGTLRDVAGILVVGWIVRVIAQSETANLRPAWISPCE
jgi:hypothetical protein